MLSHAARLGFFVSRPGAPVLVGHSGSQAGFISFFLLNPRTSTAIVAAFNTSGEVTSFKKVRQAAQALLLRAQ